MRLLPDKNRKIINCKLNSWKLIRYVKLKEGIPLVNPETKNIQLQYIADPTKHISDYSTNILGLFKINDLKISLTNDGKSIYNHYCEPDEFVSRPKYLKHFESRKEIVYFTIQISKINNYKFDFHLGSEIITAFCHVVHTPMKWNFWHFSLRWSKDNEYLHELPEKELGKGWGRQLSSAARASLVHFAETEIGDTKSLIPEKYYLKNQNKIYNFYRTVFKYFLPNVNI
ncbi:MAG: hypothetical protein ABI844_11385 [Saprospiraceae bacterium]